MKALSTIYLGLLAALLIIGCSEKDPSFSLLRDSDVFVQSPGAVNDKVDILWVIDNSGSMETSQQNVIDNFSSFIADFETKSLNFKMAVTATDGYRTIFNGNQNCSRFRDGILNSSCNTVSSGSYDGIRIMDTSTVNLSSVFLQNALLVDTARGIFGSGDERAFQSMKTALDQPLNAGFVRSDSHLAVIIVSDEEDFSHNGSGLNESYSNPGLHTVQSYIDYLDTFTSSTPLTRRYSVSAMAIFDTACRDFLNNSFTGRKVAIRYGELVDATDGVKGSLCNDFAAELSSIADNIISLATQFHLDRIPIPSSIVVKVNGELVPNVDDNTAGTGGWEYREDINSILFFGDYVPAAGSLISVSYDPVEYGS